MGELNPYAQGYSLDNPDFLRLAEACIRHNLPLNLHANEEVGHTYPGKSTAPLRHYYQLAERFPDLRLILAHWGGGLFFYELMPAVRRTLKNVWYDTAASPLLFPTAKIFNVALQCLDPHKILYGSDYPLRLYPRKQREPDFRPFLRAIDQLNLPPDIYAGIMGDNAARLFELPAAESPPPPTSPDAPVQLDAATPVALLAQAHPETRPVFERHGIPWRDAPLPHWEPLAQAAAARGIAPQTLLDALAAAISAELG
ncbi:MAG: hypothetical protein Kow0031_15890 [Anaerolineae bacterium]